MNALRHFLEFLQQHNVEIVKTGHQGQGDWEIIAPDLEPSRSIIVLGQGKNLPEVMTRALQKLNYTPPENTVHATAKFKVPVAEYEERGWAFIPSGVLGRAIVHTSDGRMEWRWYKTEEEADTFLTSFPE